jgi:hypothetical protein
MPITHFLYWTLKLNPKPLDTPIVPFKKVFFLNVKKGPIQGSICFKLVPGLLVPGPLCLDHYHGPRVLKKAKEQGQRTYTLNHQFFVGSFMRSVSSLDIFKKPGSEGLF